MITVKRRFVQQTLAGITFALVLCTLSMIWPVILTLFLGVLMLLQSFSAEPEIAVLSWAEVGNVPIVFVSLRRAELQTMLS